MGSVLEVAIAVLALVGLALISLAVRRMMLQRPHGTFVCSLRRSTQPDGAGWRYGVGRYHGDRIEWFRVFSLSPRPRWVLTRRGLVVQGRRRPNAAEEHAFPPGAVVVQVTLAGEAFELAMTPESVHGLMVWIEAAPPRDPMAA